MRAISDFQSYFLQIERISKNGLVRFNVCTSEGSKFLRGIVAFVFRLNNLLKESANAVKIVTVAILSQYLRSWIT